MTKKQEKKFLRLCKQMSQLLKELEPEHPEIMFFIEDGTPYLIAPPDNMTDELKDYIIASGEYWHRSGGGGF